MKIRNETNKAENEHANAVIDNHEFIKELSKVIDSNAPFIFLNGSNDLYVRASFADKSLMLAKLCEYMGIPVKLAMPALAYCTMRLIEELKDE